MARGYQGNSSSSLLWILGPLFALITVMDFIGFLNVISPLTEVFASISSTGMNVDLFQVAVTGIAWAFVLFVFLVFIPMVLLQPIKDLLIGGNTR